MPEGSDLIQPKAVPLTHASQSVGSVPQQRNWLLGVLIALAALLVALLFILAPGLVEPIRLPAPAPPTAAPEQAAPKPQRDDRPPPFQTLRLEQARAEAQNQLARFVELELQLREELHMGAWGQAGYENARDLAQAGDEAFVAEQFDQAIDQYRQAADALATLMQSGHERFATALAAASEAIQDQRPDAANASLAEAAAIKPNDPALLQAQTRAGHLPEVIARLRRARNQELAEDWAGALRTYEGIRTLDAQTQGLNAAIANARHNRSQQILSQRLSAGFAALGRQDFTAAEKAFQQALAIDANNSSALGGLQDVADQSVLARIEARKQQASAFAAAEQWEEAAAAYGDILAQDGNIQFARAGLEQANMQREALKALNAVIADPGRLSSDAHYESAQATVAQAKTLSPQGPALIAALRRSEALLRHHSLPVPVLLRSDGATEVLLSNVGPLGRFSEKRLQLRPGAYTLIGSRDGCRDVRTQIKVAPDMAPVDIRCREVLQP